MTASTLRERLTGEPEPAGAPAAAPRVTLDRDEAREQLRRAGAACSGELDVWVLQHRVPLLLGAIGTGVLLGSSKRVRRGVVRALSFFVRLSRPG